MTHDELRELTGGYALGILSETERREFEAHVSTCPACAQELRALTEVTDALAYAVPQVDPPAALRARVLRAAAGESDARAIAGVKPRAGSALPTWLAVAASLAAIGLGLYAVTLRQRIGDLETRLRVATSRAAAFQNEVAVFRTKADIAGRTNAILAASDVRRIELAGQKGAPGAAGRAFWSPSLGLVFTAANLPTLPTGTVYQLWVIPPGSKVPIDAGVLDPDAEGRVITLVAPAASADVGTVAVTLEPSPGVPTPTGAFALLGSL